MGMAEGLFVADEAPEEEAVELHYDTLYVHQPTDILPHTLAPADIVPLASQTCT